MVNTYIATTISCCGGFGDGHQTMAQIEKPQKKTLRL
jgi:hypothetical protein